MRPSWHKLANCGPAGELGPDATVRVNTMFPATAQLLRRARQVCEACDVSVECRRAGTLPMVRPTIKEMWCEVCNTPFSPGTRAVTCSDFCRAERLRRQDKERTMEKRKRDAATGAA